MTGEEHLRIMCGDKDFIIANLRAKIDEQQTKIDELEKPKDRSNVHDIKAG